MMLDTVTTDDLRRELPGCGPWIALLEAAIRESLSSTWDAIVERMTVDELEGRPRLARARVHGDLAPVRDWFERLLATARREECGHIARVAGRVRLDRDAGALFTGALTSAMPADVCGEPRTSEDGAALLALSRLGVFPFLQACGRAWPQAGNQTWPHPYCPICGAWPAMAEEYGAERESRYRCGGCGSAWPMSRLRCPFCGTTDHRALVEWLLEDGKSGVAVDACLNCRGYVKRFAALQPAPPESVLLRDMGTVALEMAVVGGGFARPLRPGFPIEVSLGSFDR